MRYGSVLLLLLASLAVPGRAAAGSSGPASLVRDIDPARPAPGAAQSPGQFRAVAAGVAFLTPESAADPSPKLWATDGTATGTRALQSFCEPAVCHLTPSMLADTLPGLAFFFAGSSDGPGRPMLWRTDGTAGGTFPLTAPLYSLEAVALRGRLLFLTCEETLVCALWSTDGSAAGTRKVSNVAYAYGLVTAGDRAWFFDTEGPFDQWTYSLWSTDGTPEGTGKVRRIGYFPWLLTASGSHLFFMTGDTSGELWTSDGTARGTIQPQTFSESGHDWFPRVTNYFHPLGDGSAVFVASYGSYAVDLWRSDGTLRGTRPLTRFADQSVDNLRNDQIATAGGRILFAADDPVTGLRLWASGGELATTAPLSGCPGGCPVLLADSPLAPLPDGRVAFAARDLAHGAELWASDGTGPGTRLLADLCPGACGSDPAALTAAAGAVWLRATIGGVPRLVRADGTAAGTAVLAPLPDLPADPYARPRIDLAASGSRVFFAGNDPVQGTQPWMTDGTPAGTRAVPGLPRPSGSSDPKDLAALGHRIVFTASDGERRGVWVGDASGATPLPVPPGGPDGPSQVTAAGGLAYFALDAADGAGDELWRTDGTAAGTFQLAAFPARRLGALREVGGRLLALVSSTTGEAPLQAFWTSDGTPAGTVQAFTLPDDTLGVTGVTALGGEAYFVALREGGQQLFRTDGTAAGTRPILDLDCDCSNPEVRYTRLGGAVYFELTFTGFPPIFRTDGTAAGTSQVYPLPDSSIYPRYVEAEFPVALGGSILFIGRAHGLEDGRQVLWRGRDGGKAQLLALAGRPPGYPLYDPEFTPMNGALFFRAWDPQHGMELWKTDGTPRGTAIVRDLLPGSGSADPRDLILAGGRLYFTAWDSVHGRELWTSDGTAAGTHPVEDLAPGPLSAAPSWLTVAGDRLFFAADDGETGREPWSLGVGPP